MKSIKFSLLFSLLCQNKISPFFFVRILCRTFRKYLECLEEKPLHFYLIIMIEKFYEISNRVCTICFAIFMGITSYHSTIYYSLICNTILTFFITFLYSFSLPFRDSQRSMTLLISPPGCIWMNSLPMMHQLSHELSLIRTYSTASSYIR